MHNKINLSPTFTPKMNTYTVHITSQSGATIEKRTITKSSLPDAIQYAHGLIDFIWYDYPVSAKGLLTITDDTGSTCWTETITPYEE